MWQLMTMPLSLQEDGHTALHVAAWEGDEPMMKFLFQMKANPHILDKVRGLETKCLKPEIKDFSFDYLNYLIYDCI